MEAIQITGELLALGSDDEKAMLLAAKESLKEHVVFLTCLLHLKKNVQRHLQKVTEDKQPATTQLRRTIDNDLFGPHGLCHVSMEDFPTEARQFQVLYGEYFSDRYLEDLLRRIEQRVIHPHHLDDTLPSDFMNNIPG